MRAEMTFALFIIKHNIAIASTEHAGPLFRATIAKKICFCSNKNNCCNKISGTFYAEKDY